MYRHNPFLAVAKTVSFQPRSKRRKDEGVISWVSPRWGLKVDPHEFEQPVVELVDNRGKKTKERPFLRKIYDTSPTVPQVTQEHIVEITNTIVSPRALATSNTAQTDYFTNYTNYTSGNTIYA